jgi:hypothetical protein
MHALTQPAPGDAAAVRGSAEPLAIGGIVPPVATFRSITRGRLTLLRSLTGFSISLSSLEDVAQTGTAIPLPYAPRRATVGITERLNSSFQEFSLSGISEFPLSVPPPLSLTTNRRRC